LRCHSAYFAALPLAQFLRRTVIFSAKTPQKSRMSLAHPRFTLCFPLYGKLWDKMDKFGSKWENIAVTWDGQGER
jgi:hypothetical protein